MQQVLVGKHGFVAGNPWDHLLGNCIKTKQPLKFEFHQPGSLQLRSVVQRVYSFAFLSAKNLKAKTSCKKSRLVTIPINPHPHN